MKFSSRTCFHRAALGCIVLSGWLALNAQAAAPKATRVTSSEELRAAVAGAKPGTRIELAPGDYTGGLRFENLRGEKARPIVIAAADPAKPPKFSGGPNGMHIVNPMFVELHNLHFTAATANGVSIDDGGKYSSESRGLVLKGLKVWDIGGKGNKDGLKLSGLAGFRVEDCVIENWGIGNGSGIDMVGCHDGLITGCTFRHAADQAATGGHGIQAKGGSSKIIIRGNRFEDAGQRGVNIGGGTGAPYFRPPLDQWPAGEQKCEAKDITVEGNTFVGCGAAIAFIGVDGSTVRFNTIYRPGRWALRILQENQAPELVSCRNGVFTDNVIAFHSSAWSEGGVNIGGKTDPASFKFARNHWHCIDRPQASKPKLPSTEEAGTYGGDPMFTDAEKGNLQLKAGSPAKGKGADAKKP